MKKRVLSTFSVLAFLASTQGAESGTSPLAANIANGIAMQYEVITNHGAADGLECQDLGAEWASCGKIKLTLKNSGEEINSKDWKIYFHSIRQILKVENPEFKITHITGDLHTLEPTEKFTKIDAGASVEIPYIGEYWTLFEGDYMPRAYVVAENSAPMTLKAMDTEDPSNYVKPITGENYKRTPDDKNVLATAETRFAQNSDTPLLKSEELAGKIVPQPESVTLNGGTIMLKKGVSVMAESLPGDMKGAITERLALLGVNTKGKYPIKVAVAPKSFTGDDAISGAYTITIEKKQTTITGYDAHGAFYGVQSIMSLIEQGKTPTLPLMTVKDAPRLPYRAFMVDVARNFHSKEAILRTLDLMASYKMNTLHFHLTDDEGWRLEIPGLPELTEVGGKRGHDLTEQTSLLPQLGSGPTSDNFGSGYYTRGDYLEILKYAKARGIEVIPEIDMPAHARAAVVSMEARYNKLMKEGKEAEAKEFRLMDPEDKSNVTTVQFYDKRSFINPCLPSSMNFVDKVVGEVAKMHKEAGMPLTTWHFGGDEAKNIKLGGGFQDINAEEKVAWRGTIDQSKQDKPFEKSPVAQKAVADGVVEDFEHLPSYFAEQVSKIVKKHGIPNFQAWQDGLKYSKDANEFATEETRVNFWEVLYWGGAKSAFEWTEKGYKLVVSNPDYLYLDFPYEVDPKEPGYYWATRATDTRKIFTFAPVNLPQNAETSVDRDGNGFKSVAEAEKAEVFGISSQLWSESVRDDESYEYKVFPRLIAVAERAWHKPTWELEYKKGVEFSLETTMVDKDAIVKDWTTFANVLGQREMAKMDAAGVHYRLPIPGAKIENGKLAMNVALPGLPLQYSTDSGKSWNIYDNANQPTVKGPVAIRSSSPDGKRFSRSITLDVK